MRRVGLIVVVMLVAGCSSSQGSSPTKASGAACTSLVGKPLGTDEAVVSQMSCTDGPAKIAAPGSIGCQAHGTLYYFPVSGGGFVFGALGGKWANGSADSSMTSMATAAGC